MSVRKIETHKCPYCLQNVEIEVDEHGRVYADSRWTLVADWVYHGACWDEQVRLYPPSP